MQPVENILALFKTGRLALLPHIRFQGLSSRLIHILLKMIQQIESAFHKCYLQGYNKWLPVIIKLQLPPREALTSPPSTKYSADDKEKKPSCAHPLPVMEAPLAKISGKALII